MASIVKALQKLTSTNSVSHLPRKTRFDFSSFAEGDRVYIHGKRPKFSKPLQQGGKLDLPDGFILHDEIIGARPSQTFKSNKGKPYRITFPDLDTYISSMPRKVTPVYGTYANYIVSLFDIHVTPPTSAEDDQQPLEILDAGTGHGSVTLHLARAIQAANPSVPDVPLESTVSTTERASETAESSSSSSEIPVPVSQKWQDWRQARRAIVHSVEISPTYSKHAERKVVAGFCRGLYSPHIDFHVANVNTWIDRQLEQRNDVAFLSYVFLDMPSSHRYLEKAVMAMKENALIAVFVPSITQIGDCIREIKAAGLPLRMEKALELGDGISNGRLWDVRLAFKKAKDPIQESSTTSMREVEDDRPASEVEDTQSETSFAFSSQLEDGAADHTQSETSSASSSQMEDGAAASTETGPTNAVPNEEPVMVCRPKVGERVIGGGFVGLWRRTSPQ